MITDCNQSHGGYGRKSARKFNLAIVEPRVRLHLVLKLKRRRRRNNTELGKATVNGSSGQIVGVFNDVINCVYNINGRMENSSDSDCTGFTETL